MPNLRDVIENPKRLAESVNEMMSGRYRRADVAINHGFSTPDEVAAHVARSPREPENIQAYQQILEEIHEQNRQ